MRRYAFLSQAQSGQPIALVPSEYLAKLPLTTPVAVSAQSLAVVPSSSAPKTASLLSLIAAQRIGTESIIDAVERYGHLDKLYSLIISELDYSGE